MPSIDGEKDLNLTAPSRFLGLLELTELCELQVIDSESVACHSWKAVDSFGILRLCASHFLPTAALFLSVIFIIRHG